MPPSRYQKNCHQKHKRRNNLVILCQLRLALRLLYYSSLTLRGQFFCHPVLLMLFSWSGASIGSFLPVNNDSAEWELQHFEPLRNEGVRR